MGGTKVKPAMKNNHRAFLTALTFLVLFSGSAFCQERKGKREYWDYYMPDPKQYCMSETHYKNGRKDGLETCWNASGRKLGERNFQNEKPDGLNKRLFESGKKKFITLYKNGKGHGIRKEWGENEKLIFQGIFVDGNEVIG